MDSAVVPIRVAPEFTSQPRSLVVCHQYAAGEQSVERTLLLRLYERLGAAIARGRHS